MFKTRYDTDRQGLVKVRSFLSALGLNAAAVAKTFDDDERAVTRAARRKEMMAGIGYRRGSSRFPVGVVGKITGLYTGFRTGRVHACRGRRTGHPHTYANLRSCTLFYSDFYTSAHYSIGFQRGL